QTVVWAYARCLKRFILSTNTNCRSLLGFLALQGE
ncbi:MAG: hypothetical protein ACI9S7_001468, partial [Candidatus Paceibacteria bacterium]